MLGCRADSTLGTADRRCWHCRHVQARAASFANCRTTHCDLGVPLAKHDVIPVANGYLFANLEQRSWTLVRDIDVGCLCCSTAWRKIWKEMLVLFVIATIGMNIKETFYGWISGIAIGWMIASVVCWRKDFRSSLRAALPLIPILIIPLIAVALRYKFGGLGAQTNLDSDITGRYQFSLGENL